MKRTRRDSNHLLNNAQVYIEILDNFLIPTTEYCFGDDKDIFLYEAKGIKSFFFFRERHIK